MIARAIIAVAAVLVVTSFARTDAMARGGGSFHNGSIGAFRAPGFAGARQSGSNWGRTVSRGFRPHGPDPQHGDSRGKNEHDADGRNGRSDGDHWHQSPSFGETGRKSSNVVGEWHRSPGFGNSGRKTSKVEDGEWHVDPK
jgi:hypothetical protein